MTRLLLAGLLALITSLSGDVSRDVVVLLPDGPIVNRHCYQDDDFASVTRRMVNGVPVDLQCGDQFLVTSQGHCLIVGPRIVPIRCTMPH